MITPGVLACVYLYLYNVARDDCYFVQYGFDLTLMFLGTLSRVLQALNESLTCVISSIETIMNYEGAVH